MLPNYSQEKIPPVKQVTVQDETRPNWGPDFWRRVLLAQVQTFSFGYCALPTRLPTM